MFEDSFGSWLRDLSAALPEWEAFTPVGGLNIQWFERWREADMQPPACSERLAAKVVLQTPTLGSLAARQALFRRFESRGPDRYQLERLKAMRYLMHGCIEEADDLETPLYVSDAQVAQSIWPRLIEQLLALEADEKQWVYLDECWASELAPIWCKLLQIFSINAEGVWALLQKPGCPLSELRFSAESWSAENLAFLMQELSRAAGSDLSDLRRVLSHLHIHTLVSDPDTRIALLDANDETPAAIYLDAPGLDDQVPEDVRGLWQRLRRQLRLVKRLAKTDLAYQVQESLFQTEHLQVLNWHHALKHILSTERPADFAPFILLAFQKVGSLAVSGLQHVDTLISLPLNTGEVAYLEQVIDIEKINPMLQVMFKSQDSHLISILDLEGWIVQHPGFKALQNHMPKEPEMFKLLADWLAQRPEWHLGFGPDSAPDDKHKLLMALQQVQEHLPAVELLLRFYEANVPQNQLDLALKHLWPAVLKPFGTEQVYQRLEVLFASFNELPQPLALNAYLKQYDAEVLRHFLPRLRLQNMQGRWLPARELIWPSHSVNVSVQLCKEQSGILQSKLLGQSTAAHALTPDAAEKSKAAQLYDPVKAAKTLRQFIKHFQDSGLVSDNVLAAFVAMLGDDPHIVRILNTLLKTDLRQTEEEFIAGLLGDQYEHYADLRARARFHFELVKQERARLPNLLGEKIHVALTDNIDTLIVGSTDETKWKTHWYGDAKDAYQIMRLRWIDNLSDLSDPVEVFAKTIALIITEIYARSTESIGVEHIRKFVGDVADAGQMDLRRSQSFLMDMAELRLQSLGLRTSPQIKAILDQFNQIREQRINADMLKSRHNQKSQENKTKAERDLQVLNQNLKQMLESDAEMHQALVQAIQHKMTDYQYNLASVPFEIYQNADDACAERFLLGEGPPDNASDRFVLTLDTAKQQLCFIHGGRPINYYGSDEQLKQRGFDKDLQKMLTLTFSDKGLDAEQSKNTTTGHFGLGFKSVFFVSSLPRVLSGRLAFEVRAGFYPVALKPEQTEALRKKAREFDIKDRQATVIELSWQDPQQTDRIQKSITAFQQEADLMVIFSRQIKQIVTVVDQVQETIRFQAMPLAAVAGLRVVRSNSSQYLVFGCSFKADQQPASLLFALDTHGLKKMPSGISNLWITTPTQERSDIGWVLNAPLKPDAGRQVLARQNPQNHEIARLTALQWGEQLVRLYDYQVADWSAFAKSLALHDSATLFAWWKSFWVIVTQGKCVLAFENLNHGGELLNWLAWGQDIGAARHLYTSRPTIPNGFEGTQERLMHLDQIHFYLDDLLKTDNNLVFQHISQWPSFQKRYPLESIVKPAIADALMKQHLKDKSQLQEITLLDVLLNEIGKKKELSPDKAKRLARLIQDCPLAFDEDIYRDEVIRLYHELSEKVTFKARSGNYRPASDLLIGQYFSDVEADEVWRSYFAPDDYCLHPDYTEAGVTLFRHVRQVLKAADVKQMAQWVKNPDHLSAEQFKALLGYLCEGELAQKLADTLGKSWFNEVAQKPDYAALTDEDMQRELKRKFRCYDDLAVHTPWVTEEERYQRVMDPEDALQKIDKWWKKQQSKEIQKQQSLYPFDFSAHLLWPDDPDWDSQAHRSWLLLFFHAALMPLGLNKLRRDNAFLHFLESDQWLTAFEQVSDQPTRLLKTLDAYLDQPVSHLKHHFQMRQFIAFYAISKNIENFLDLLKQAEKDGDFASMFNPNVNPNFIGSGVRIPPFDNILGIGTSFIIRELYRLRHFSHRGGYAYAYTPLRKVRILCQQIFGVDFEPNAHAFSASKAIFNTLQQAGAGSRIDITFGHCFDLPLQILAEDRVLQKQILQENVEVPDTEDDWLDLLQAETEGYGR